MVNAFVVRWTAVLVVFLTTVSVLPAQFVESQVKDEDWARAMIDKDQLHINYKSVAKGQDVYFKIRVKNIYKEEMQITGLSTSCGCISWDENRGTVVENRGGILPVPIVIPSGKEQFITLRLDTVRHQGEQKNKLAHITFMNTSAGPVLGRGAATITVEGYIRSDVVLQPGSVNFGSVDPEKGAEQRVVVNYAGRSDWKLISATCSSPFLSAQIEEKSRANGLVHYDVVVKLKETARSGQLRDQLILVTDDINNPQIPIQVDARIESDIIVTDANFGTLIPGKPKTIRVIVRCTKTPAKPFKIDRFERTRDEANIKVEKSAELKPLHQLVLTFTPPNEPGPFVEDFYLTVSGRTEPIVFKARGSIQAAPADTGVR